MKKKYYTLGNSSLECFKPFKNRPVAVPVRYHTRKISIEVESPLV
jgi:hypothetical protein